MTNRTSSEGQPTLRILHLSDFHFQIEKKWDQDPVLVGLTDAIRKLCDDDLAPDFVAFTGDIAHSGTKQEYDEASKWIDERLAPALPSGLDDTRLLFVPGNHDVDRQQVKKSQLLLQKDLLDQWSQDAIADTLSDDDERKSLLKRHKAYMKFAKRFGPSDKSNDEPWWQTSRSVGDKTIHISGVCSSWMSCGDEDQSRLLIGQWQLNKVLPRSGECDLCVVLVHHPWSYLPDCERGDTATQVHREANLVLRGHLHQQQSSAVTDPDNACVELAAGSVYDGSKYPNAFQLVEILPDQMLAHVHYRTWHNGKWIVDRNAYENASDGVAAFSLQPPADDKTRRDSPVRASRPAVPESYRTWLRDQRADIELLGLKVKQGQAVRLNHIYVPLTTTPQAKQPVDEGNEQQPPSMVADDTPTLLLDQLNESSLYVPGAPGAGKSTFCRWVAYLTANRTMPQLDVAPPDGYGESFPAALRDRFPLLVRLRDFWSFLPMKPASREMSAAELEGALCHWIDEKELTGISGNDLASHLAHGSALLILDGVDEVPLSQDDLSSPREMLLSGLMEALPQWHEQGNRVLLTSRPYGLTEDVQRRWDLRHASINSLPSELQTLLVRRWFHALMDDVSTAQATASDMMKHVGERDGMSELASNPMLLTAMCIIYGEGKRLPQDTYDLYGRIVDNVLYNRFPMDPVLIDKVRNRLAVVAYGMHTGDALNETRSTPQAAASYDELDCILRKFQEESPETEPGAQHTVRTREQLLSETGLLLPQGDKRAGFYHLSLQEFLAAQRILNLGNDPDHLFAVFQERAVVSEWRKTLSFLFACLVAKFTAQHGIQLLTRLVADIDSGTTDAAAASKAVVAADCVEILVGREIGLQDTLRASLRRLFVRIVESDAHEARTLRTVGSCLGLVGDPRIVDDLRDLTNDMAYVLLSAEGGKPTILVSRYPVTNSQYRVFLKAGGYTDETNWSDEGLRWLRSRPGVSSPLPVDAGISNNAASVTYWQAEAYANWLGLTVVGESETRDREAIGGRVYEAVEPGYFGSRLPGVFRKREAIEERNQTDDPGQTSRAEYYLAAWHPCAHTTRPGAPTKASSWLPRAVFRVGTITHATRMANSAYAARKTGADSEIGASDEE